MLLSSISILFSRRHEDHQNLGYVFTHSSARKIAWNSPFLNPTEARMQTYKSTQITEWDSVPSVSWAVGASQGHLHIMPSSCLGCSTSEHVQLCSLQGVCFMMGSAFFVEICKHPSWAPRQQDPAWIRQRSPRC